MRLMVVSILAVGMGAAPVPAQTPTDSSLPNVETVGTAERRVAPDRASVMLFVETRAASAAAAASANTRAVQAVRDTLRAAGLDSAATTASYHVGPHYEPNPVRGEPQRSGYSARTVLRVQLTRLDLVGRVIDAALAKGATGVENVWFESSRIEETRRAALADAAEAARRDAEALARALGGALGPLLSTSTASAFDPRRMNMAMAERSFRTTQITPSEIVVSAGVVTRWQFIPR